MRKLSIRERALLLCLAVVASVSGYILFFQQPMAQKTESLLLQLEQSRELAGQLDQRLEAKRQMQLELSRLSQETDPLPVMPEYDNLKAVMRELNAILQDSMEYSLTFQEEEAEEHDRILIRRVTIPFTCSGYAQAQEILTRLHDSSLRCMIENLQILQQTDGNVRVTAVIAFYEYQTNQA